MIEWSSLPLPLWLSLWLSAVIVAAVWGGISYFLVQQGMGLIEAADLTPQRTMDTLKEITRERPEEHRHAA